MIHQRHRQTDGQTTCDSKTAVCTAVHRAIKTTILCDPGVIRPDFHSVEAGWYPIKSIPHLVAVRGDAGAPVQRRRAAMLSPNVGLKSAPTPAAIAVTNDASLLHRQQLSNNRSPNEPSCRCHRATACKSQRLCIWDASVSSTAS